MEPGTLGKRLPNPCSHDAASEGSTTDLKRQFSELPLKAEEGPEDFKAHANRRSPVFALSPIWPVIFFIGCSIGLTAPLETYISLNFFAQKYTSLEPADTHCEITPNATYCKEAVKDNVFWTSASAFSTAVIHVALGTALGAVSDAHGRRPVLVVCVFLQALPPVAQALFVYFNTSLYFWFALNMFAHLPVVGVWFALVTDLIQNPEDRVAAFGFVLVGFEVSVFLGMVVGMTLTLRVAVVCGLVFHVLQVFYLLFFLQETFPLKKRRPLKRMALVPVAGLSILMRNVHLRRLAFIFTASSFLGPGIAKVATNYFVKHFDWDKQSNYISAISGQLSTLVWVGLALRPIAHACGGEVGLLAVGQLAGGLYLAFLTITGSAWQVMVLQGLLFGSMALAFPATAALKGSMVEESEQGHVQGAVQTVKSVAASLGPVFFGLLFNTFDTTEEWTPSCAVVFIVGAVLHFGLLPIITSLPRDLLKAGPSSNSAGHEHVEVPTEEPSTEDTCNSQAWLAAPEAVSTKENALSTGWRSQKLTSTVHSSLSEMELI